MKNFEQNSATAMAMEFDRYLLAASPPRADFYLYNAAETLEELVLESCFDDILVSRSKPRNNRGSSNRNSVVTVVKASDDNLLDDCVPKLPTPSDSGDSLDECQSGAMCLETKQDNKEQFSGSAQSEFCDEDDILPPRFTRQISKSKSESALNASSDGRRLKKKVSFADETGDRLATYQVIPRRDSPLYTLDDSCFLFSSFATRPVATSSTSSSSSSILRSCFDSVTSYTGQPINASDLLPNCVDSVHTICSLGFDQPSSSFSSFLNRLDRDSVCLENAKVEDSGVLCTVRVKNIAFEKTVLARVTYDNWVTSEEVPARFVPCGVSAPMYDMFSFKIDSPPQHKLRNIGPANAEFAICYKANGQDFWDNNRGSNYKVMWMLRQRCSRPA